jgi:hypothetical protein
VSSADAVATLKAEREELEAGRRRARRLEKRVAAERQEMIEAGRRGKEAGTRAQEEAAGVLVKLRTV